MIATKETKSHALGIAEDGAKIADNTEAGARRSSSATPTPKYLDNDDEERSGGSSLDDEFLSYLSGNTPPPVPPPPSVVSMVPASARKETNRASIEASMMRATAGPGNASWRAMLVAQAQALLDTAEAAAEADIAEDGARRRPPPRGDGLVRSLPREAVDRRTSDDPLPSTSITSLPPKSRRPRNPAPPALAAPHAQYRHPPPAERSAS